MTSRESASQHGDKFYVLVTGTNSGIGLGIGLRLIEEFLQTRPQHETLVLIITTRNQRKGDATIQKLQDRLRKVCQQRERTLPGITQVLEQRVELQQERLDLLRLVSVQELSAKLRKTLPHLNVLVCNAGIGGWTGMNWPLVTWSMMTKFVTANTWPTFKLAGLGWIAKPQIPAEKQVEEPPLGEVFCANFFGHYLLGHYLAPLLAKHSSTGARGRLIWVSSLEAYDHAFDINDMQGFTSNQPYESSKRLTDLMAITSALPSTSDLVNHYLASPTSKLETTNAPRIYTSHPGICGTAIAGQPLILQYLMFLAFYMARWLGSQWHGVTAEKGATAIVWLALVKQSMLDSMEAREGIGKWGSATDTWGQERVERTEVAGWGWGGKVGEVKRRGRDPYAKDLTEKDRMDFEELGRRCWVEMERLREEWEARLESAGVDVGMPEGSLCDSG